MRDLFASAGVETSSNEIIAFGRTKERAGKFGEAIEAYAAVDAVAQLQDLARNVIERERETVGRIDLSPEARRIALKALNAIASLENRLAA